MLFLTNVFFKYKLFTMSNSKSNIKYSKQGLKDLWKNVVWIVRISFSLIGKKTILTFILPIISPLTSILSSYVFAYLIDNVITFVADDGEFVFSWSNSIVRTISIFLAIQMFISFVNNFNRYIQRTSWEPFSVKLRVMLHRKIANLDIQAFEDRQIANEINKARDQVWKIQNFVNYLLQFLSSAMSVVVAIGILWKFSVGLIITLMLLTIPDIWIQILWVERGWRIVDRNQENWRVYWQALGDLINPRYIYEHKISNSLGVRAEKGVSFCLVSIGSPCTIFASTSVSP